MFEFSLRAFIRLFSSSYSSCGSRVSHFGDDHSRHPVDFSIAKRVVASKLEVSSGSSSPSVNLNENFSEPAIISSAIGDEASSDHNRRGRSETGTQTEPHVASKSNVEVGEDSFIVCPVEAAKFDFSVHTVADGVNANQGFQISNHDFKLVLD